MHGGFIKRLQDLQAAPCTGHSGRCGMHAFGSNDYLAAQLQTFQLLILSLAAPAT